MNRDEEYAVEFLNKNGCGILCREPLGNSSFPDFVTSNQIAIEIRRLNKHLQVDDETESIDNPQFYKLVKILKDELTKLDFERPNSISVSLQYRRPIEFTKRFRKQLINSIQSASREGQFNEQVRISDNISVTLFEGYGRGRQAYDLVVICDYDRGGEVNQARYDALKIAVADKSSKVEPVKGQFRKFWLILVDDIFSRVDEYSTIDLHKFPPIESNFDRIILLHQRDLNQWQDLLPWKSP